MVEPLLLVLFSGMRVWYRFKNWKTCYPGFCWPRFSGVLRKKGNAHLYPAWRSAASRSVVITIQEPSPLSPPMWNVGAQRMGHLAQKEAPPLHTLHPRSKQQIKTWPQLSMWIASVEFLMKDISSSYRTLGFPVLWKYNFAIPSVT